MHAVGRVHAKLYTDETHAGTLSAETYLCDLLTDIERSLGVTLRSHIDAIDLPVDVAIPMALLVNELVTNSAKHAHPPPTNVCVALRREDGGWRLVVQDDGPGLATLDTKVLGFRISRGLALQLGGELALSNGQGNRVELAVAAA